MQLHSGKELHTCTCSYIQEKSYIYMQLHSGKELHTCTCSYIQGKSFVQAVDIGKSCMHAVTFKERVKYTQRKEVQT